MREQRQTGSNSSATKLLIAIIAASALVGLTNLVAYHKFAEEIHTGYDKVQDFVLRGNNDNLNDGVSDVETQDTGSISSTSSSSTNKISDTSTTSQSTDTDGIGTTTHDIINMV